MSAFLDLSCNSPYSERDETLSFKIDISLSGGLTASSISNITLVVNDENMVNSTQYINVPIPNFVNGNASIVYQLMNGLVNGSEYTARAMLETFGGALFKSQTVTDILPFTIPAKPSMVRIDGVDNQPLVDYGFNLKLNLTNYDNGGSPLTGVKFVWHRIDSNGSGVLDFLSFPYAGENGIYSIDLTQNMLLTDLCFNPVFSVNVVTRNLAGESIISDPLILNPKNIPSAPTGLSVTFLDASSSYSVSKFKLAFSIPQDYSNNSSASSILTYKVLYDTSSNFTNNSSFAYFSGNQVYPTPQMPNVVYVLLDLSSNVYNNTMYFKVSASNFNGSSDYSNTNFAIPFTSSLAPSQLSYIRGPIKQNYTPASYAEDASDNGNNKVFVSLNMPSPLVLGSNLTFDRIEFLDASSGQLIISDNSFNKLYYTIPINNYISRKISSRIVSKKSGTDIIGATSSILDNVVAFTYPDNITSINSVGGSGYIDVSWSASRSYNGFPVTYKFEYKLSNENSWNINVFNLTQTTFRLTGLATGSTYVVRVTPYFVDGSTQYFANSSTSTVITSVGVSQIQNLIAKSGPMKSDFSVASISSDAFYSGDRQIYLSWNSLTDAELGLLGQSVVFSKYEIFDACTNTLVKNVNDRNASSVLLGSSDGINNNESRQFKIRAVVLLSGSTVNGPFSLASIPVVSFIFPTALPNSPTALVGNNNIALSWNNSTFGINNVSVVYKVDYKLTSSLEWITYVDGFTGLTLVINNLLNNVQYSLRVTPYVLYNGYTYFGTSSSINATPMTGPSKITGLLALSGPLNSNNSPVYTAPASFDGNNKIRLVWNNPTDSDLGLVTNVTFSRYEIYDADNTTLIANIANRLTTTYDVTSTNGLARRFIIRAVTRLGVGAGSDYNGTFSDPTPSVFAFTFPSNVTGIYTESTTNSVIVNWSQLASQSGLTPEYAVDVSGSPTGRVFVTDSPYTFNAVAGNVYSVRVSSYITVFNNKYFSTPSNYVSQTVIRQPTSPSASISQLSANDATVIINKNFNDASYVFQYLHVRLFQGPVGQGFLGANTIGDVSYNGLISPLFNLQNGLTTGVVYNLQINGVYTFNGITVWSEEAVVSVTPASTPIVISQTIGWTSGDIQLTINPNGNSLSSITLVGVPSSIQAQWNYVYMVNQLQNNSIGNSLYTITNPFNKLSSTVLSNVHILVTNAVGTTSLLVTRP
jgi:hypothetical protein